MSQERGPEVQPTAGLLVHVFPAGKGQVIVGVKDLGPNRLTRDEAVLILRSAADQMEARG